MFFNTLIRISDNDYFKCAISDFDIVIVEDIFNLIHFYDDNILNIKLMIGIQWYIDKIT